MYTRCPECASTHLVNAAILSQSRGRVRCGHCQRRFDALAALFDEWPDHGDSPPPAGSRYRPPVLGSPDSLSMPFGPATVHHPERGRRRGWWIAVLLILLLVTAGNAAWMLRAHWTGHPALTPWLERTGWFIPDPPKAYRSPEDIQVVSRDLHSHPTVAGVLVLSATIANRAPRPQPWPTLELTLLDVNGKPLARRRFAPREYLPAGAEPGSVMAVDAHAPVLLEFMSPGRAAVGFKIDFL